MLNKTTGGTYIETNCSVAAWIIISGGWKWELNKQNERSKQQTGKQAMPPVFFWSDAMVEAIACGQNEQASKSHKQKQQRNKQKENK